VSPGIESIFGVSKEEIIGSNWMKKVNWESRDLERAGKNINDMVSGIEYRRIEMSFRHPDGKRRTVFISPHPIDNIDGSVVSIEGIVEDITDRKRVEEEREKLINELQAALNEIKTLRGILPLCSFCKKVRDDKGYWEQVDVYIHKYSQADISHSVCPDCAKKHYPDLHINDD
jgi:PAS domain S-box-containing protein